MSSTVMQDAVGSIDDFLQFHLDFDRSRNGVEKEVVPLQQAVSEARRPSGTVPRPLQIRRKPVASSLRKNVLKNNFQRSVDETRNGHSMGAAAAGGSVRSRRVDSVIDIPVLPQNEHARSPSEYRAYQLAGDGIPAVLRPGGLGRRAVGTDRDADVLRSRNLDAAQRDRSVAAWAWEQHKSLGFPATTASRHVHVHAHGIPPPTTVQETCPARVAATYPCPDNGPLYQTYPHTTRFIFDPTPIVVEAPSPPSPNRNSTTFIDRGDLGGNVAPDLARFVPTPYFTPWDHVVQGARKVVSSSFWKDVRKTAKRMLTKRR